MKKLVTAFAACALAGLAFAQVESVNIVGYQTLTASGQFFSTGPTFISVGDLNGQWRLGDVVVSGMDPFNDIIQFLNPSTANNELAATYVDEATSIAVVGNTSMVGWWNTSFDTSYDDLMFDAGTSFLCNLTSTGVSFMYAGEVLNGTIAVDASGLQYPFIANMTPVDLTLGDITASGMDPFNDIIQFLSTTTANNDLAATYIDEATSIAVVGNTSMVGWWNTSFDTSLNAQPVPAGTGFLGNFTSTAITINFPDPVL